MMICSASESPFSRFIAPNNCMINKIMKTMTDTRVFRIFFIESFISFSSKIALLHTCSTRSDQKQREWNQEPETGISFIQNFLTKNIGKQVYKRNRKYHDFHKAEHSDHYHNRSIFYPPGNRLDEN